jgi:hypothetical protein
MTTTDDDNLVLAELNPIQKRIDAAECESIPARWEFGRVLLKHRGEKKQLPRGWRAEIIERFGLESSEITRRMQLAEKFPTVEQVVDACTRCGGSWRRIIREELVKRRGGQGKPQAPWAESKNSTADRWLREAGGSDERVDALVALARRMLKTLGADSVEVAA